MNDIFIFPPLLMLKWKDIWLKAELNQALTHISETEVKWKVSPLTLRSLDWNVPAFNGSAQGEISKLSVFFVYSQEWETLFVF